MSDKFNKALDAHLAKERRRWLLVALIGFVLLLVFGAVFLPISSTTVHGKTISLSAKQTIEGSKWTARVELDSGETVFVSFPRHLSFKAGEKAVLIEGKSLIGWQYYRLVRYEP